MIFRVSKRKKIKTLKLDIILKTFLRHDGWLFSTITFDQIQNSECDLFKIFFKYFDFNLSK